MHNDASLDGKGGVRQQTRGREGREMYMYTLNILLNYTWSPANL